MLIPRILINKKIKYIMRNIADSTFLVISFNVYFMCVVFSVGKQIY